MRIVVVGLGVMGSNHVRVLKSLGQSVTTVDPNPAQAADYRTLLEALGQQRFDVACIAAPPQTLPWEATNALKAGCHVLIEKPMATRLDDAEGLVRLAAEVDRQLLVGYTERYNPAVNALAWQLPLVGEIRSVSARRLGPHPNRSTAGVLLDMATHDLDVLHYLGFQPVPLLQRVGCWVLDADGATVTLEVAHHHACKVRTLTITGEHGMLAVDYQAQTLDHYGAEGVQRLPVSAAEPLVSEWSDFLSAIGDETPHNGACGEDGIKVLQLALSMVAVTPESPDISL